MTEEQKINELLKPRYVVEIKYPGCPFKKGDVLVQSRSTNFFGCSDKGAALMGRIPEAEIKKCPEIFRKLEWHEERDASEMPEYVKPDPNGALEQFRSKKTIYKVRRWVRDDNNLWCEVGKHDHIHVNHIIPATSSEYNNYNNAQKIQL